MAIDCDMFEEYFGDFDIPYIEIPSKNTTNKRTPLGGFWGSILEDEENIQE